MAYTFAKRCSATVRVTADRCSAIGYHRSTFMTVPLRPVLACGPRGWDRLPPCALQDRQSYTRPRDLPRPTHHVASLRNIATTQPCKFGQDMLRATPPGANPCAPPAPCSSLAYRQASYLPEVVLPHVRNVPRRAQLLPERCSMSRRPNVGQPWGACGQLPNLTCMLGTKVASRLPNAGQARAKPGLTYPARSMTSNVVRIRPHAGQLHTESGRKSDGVWATTPEMWWEQGSPYPPQATSKARALAQYQLPLARQHRIYNLSLSLSPV